MVSRNRNEQSNSRGLGIIIGGSGLIGGALVYYFKTRVENFEILAPNSKRLSLCNPDDIRLYFQQYKPSFIINAAIASIDSGAKLAYEINYLGALNLAEVAIEFNIPYIHISSAATMPMGKDLSEKDRLPLRADLPNYAKSKLMAEMTLEHLAASRGLDYTIVRLAVVYGKHDHKIQGFHRLLFSIADRAMPILLTKKGAMHSYSNAKKLPLFVYHILENRMEFSGQTYNFADPEPVELRKLILTIKSLMNLKTPREVFFPYILAKTGKGILCWFLSKLIRIGIEARMPGELMFLENFYESQTLSVEKLLQSSFEDPQPQTTVYSVLPEFIEYYLTRWESLNLIVDFNKEFYSSKNSRMDDFVMKPNDLLTVIHKEKGSS
jgi:nucleoside-diphosphate-sugar epimerase